MEPCWNDGRRAEEEQYSNTEHRTREKEKEKKKA
jgi:hypothetical protein